MTRNSALREAPRAISAIQSRTASRIGSILIVLSLLIVIGLSVGRLSGVLGAFWATDSDQVSAQQSKDRQNAFQALGLIQLPRVQSGELDEAIVSMKLSSEEQAQLSKRLFPWNAMARSAPDAGQTESPQPSIQDGTRRIPLAWVTLWDTDAMDQDVVRLESDGYSYTVTLSKSAVTVAVPVPQTGVINVTGVRDGGGGITVGIMSGSNRVALPLMSEDQVIGIPVSVS